MNRQNQLRQQALTSLTAAISLFGLAEAPLHRRCFFPVNSESQASSSCSGISLLHTQQTPPLKPVNGKEPQRTGSKQGPRAGSVAPVQLKDSSGSSDQRRDDTFLPHLIHVVSCFQHQSDQIMQLLTVQQF